MYLANQGFLEISDQEDKMTEKVLYWVTMVSAATAFLLFIANASLIHSNQQIQADINQKQMVVNTAQRVMPLNQQLSNALYDSSVKKNDAKIRDLLTTQGFKLPEKVESGAAKIAEQPKAKKPVKEEE
ncbi:MAG TPA: hypothetical protein DCY07_06565 [Rhodospirillaceae bacterium]|nr:hypothetical protein [Rhodospirillaceae bacterium]